MGIKNYNKIPHLVGDFPLQVDETFSFLYLPIKLAGQPKPIYEERLKVFDKIIGAALCNFVGLRGLDEFVDSYIYITAKNLYQKKDGGFNRSGWHSDGYGTNDISYIWSNRQPTVFNSGTFLLTNDDEKSMVDMEEQADEANNFTLPNNSLIRMDQFSIHRVGEIEEGVRCFVKICFSKDKYNLIGNSRNFLLDYQWEMQERKKTRNIPQALSSIEDNAV